MSLESLDDEGQIVPELQEELIGVVYFRQEVEAATSAITTAGIPNSELSSWIGRMVLTYWKASRTVSSSFLLHLPSLLLLLVTRPVDLRRSLGFPAPTPLH